MIEQKADHVAEKMVSHITNYNHGFALPIRIRHVRGIVRRTGKDPVIVAKSLGPDVKLHFIRERVGK